MAKRNRVKPPRAATPEDLESLVRALGPLIRQSVRDEVLSAFAGAGLKPTAEEVKSITCVDSSGALVQSSPKPLGPIERVLAPMRADLERLEGCVRDVSKQLNTSLALENQRLAKERDIEQRAWLGKIDLARHPERTGITPAQRAEADAANAKFLADQEEMRLADARAAQAEGLGLREAGSLKLPETVEGETVPKRERGGLLGP